MVVESVSVLDFRNLAACEVELGPGAEPALGPERRRQDEPARGDLHGARRPLVPDPRRPRDDRLRPVAGAQRGGRRRRRPSADRSSARSAAPRAAATWSTARRRAPRRAALRPALAVFMPDRLALVKGPPAGRRNHLDGFCAALWPARAEARRRYSRALAQRNALLGRIRAGVAGRGQPRRLGRSSSATAGVELSGDPRRRRSSGSRRRSPRPPTALGLGERRALRLPAAQRGDRRRPTLAAELAERREGDIARGYTGWGPHHDELAIESRRPLAAPLRLAGPAARRAAGAAVRRAPRAARRRPPGAADAARRRHQRARRRPPAAAGRAPRRRRRPGADHRDRARPPARGRRAARDRDPRRAAAGPGRRRRARRRDPPRASRARLGDSVRGACARDAQPATLLAAVQGCWRAAVGERIAAEARPVRERDGVITVECRAATWAQELDLLQDELLATAQRGARRAPASSRSAPGRRRRSRPRHTLVRDLQGFCSRRRGFPGAVAWYPYVNLYPGPEPPGLGPLARARRSGFLMTATEGPNSSGN